MRNRIIIKDVPAPVIEIDPGAMAVYIRFRKAKVHKTISDDRSGAVVAVDLDEKNQPIGLEVVGVREFSIKAIRKAVPTEFKRIDFEGARFMPAASCLEK